MLIKAAINGGRTKAEHPRVPVTPAEQASAILECVAAGVNVIHLHVRSDSGAESLDPKDVANTMIAVRAAAPSASIGVSTGDWMVANHAERMELVSGWQVLPDFASVNFIETGAAELSQLLLSKGVGVEAGLSDPEAARIFVDSGLAPQCLRVLLEPQEQEIEAARETVRGIELLLDENQISLERVLHGTEATPWPMLKDALKKGYGIRIGFEDTLQLTNGDTAASNLELINDALALISDY
jgi:uncharacterized protein (DUF849 family)